MRQLRGVHSQSNMRGVSGIARDDQEAGFLSLAVRCDDRGHPPLLGTTTKARTAGRLLYELGRLYSRRDRILTGRAPSHRHLPTSDVRLHIRRRRPQYSLFKSTAVAECAVLHRDCDYMRFFRGVPRILVVKNSDVPTWQSSTRRYGFRWRRAPSGRTTSCDDFPQRRACG